MGKHSRSHPLTSTGLSPAPAPLSNGLRPHARFLTPHPTGRWNTSAPTTPLTQPLPGITRKRFSLIRFRSPLLSESLLFSLPTGTEMFHFPVFPPHTLFHSGAGNWTQLQLGFPIRTSPDQRSVANSPGLIAGSYVLHRLLVPRHPPCALSSLSCYKDARVHCVVLKIRAVPPQVLRFAAWPSPVDRLVRRGDGP